MKLIHRIILLCVVIPLCIGFAILNRDNATVDFLVLEVEMPVYVWMLGTLAIGILIGQAISWLSASRWRRRARSGERQAKKLETEVTSLRDSAQPVQENVPAIAASGPRQELANRARSVLNDS